MRFMQTTSWATCDESRMSADLLWATCWPKATNNAAHLLTMSRKKRMPQTCWHGNKNATLTWSCQFHMQACTLRAFQHLPAEIRFHCHFQTLKFQICFARCISTRWCGVNFDCSPSHLTFHSGFRTHGARCHLVHDASSDASCCCHLVLRSLLSALATMTRRKYTLAVSASLRFEMIPPL